MNQTNPSKNVACNPDGRHCTKVSFWSRLLKKSIMENFIFCGVIAKTLKNTITLLGGITNISKSCAGVVIGKRL